MITKDQLERSIKRLQGDIDAIDPGICGRFPISAYVNDVKSFPQLRMHSYFGPRRKKILSTIQKDYGFHAIALYQKLTLCFIMKDSLTHLKAKSFPKGVMRNIHSWYQRVVEDFDRQPDSYYDISKVDFNIDFGVCCFKSIPIGGAWFVQFRIISPRVFLTFNIRRIKQILRFILFKTSGLFPYCIIHTIPRYMLRFNCQQMNMAYKEIGELMKYYPNIKGIFRKSWFLDPNLENLSPEMTYLRKIPERNGAMLFKTGTADQDIKDALAFSSYRRNLYKEGKYSPVVYGYIWPRKEFLEWLVKLDVDEERA
ncbi:MAG: hypothetical protein PVJ87_11075 [Desulfobacterales bacterium]|jgi:hypothetical protein